MHIYYYNIIDVRVNVIDFIYISKNRTTLKKTLIFQATRMSTTEFVIFFFISINFI